MNTKLKSESIIHNSQKIKVKWIKCVYLQQASNLSFRNNICASLSRTLGREFSRQLRKFSLSIKMPKPSNNFEINKETPAETPKSTLNLLIYQGGVEGDCFHVCRSKIHSSNTEEPKPVCSQQTSIIYSLLAKETFFQNNMDFYVLSKGICGEVI